MLNKDNETTARDRIIQQFQEKHTAPQNKFSVISILPSGIIDHLNTSAKKIFQEAANRSYNTGDSIFRFIPFSGLKGFANNLYEVLDGTISSAKIEFSFSKNILVFTLLPVLDKKGGIQKVSAIIDTKIGKTGETVWPKNNRQHDFEEEQEVVFQLIRRMGSAKNLNSAFAETIRILAAFFNFSIAEAWEAGFDKKTIKKVAQFTVLKNQIWKDDITSFEKHHGFPGICWETKKIEIWEDLAADTRFLRRPTKSNSGISFGIAVPIIVKEKVIAVLTFFGEKHHAPGLKNLNSLERISVQIATEIKRKITEEHLRNVYKFSPNLIAVIGIDGYLKKVNPAFTKTFGYFEQELLSTPFQNFLHPLEKEETLIRLKEVTQGRNPQTFSNRCKAKNGDWKWISWTPSNLAKEEGIVHLFGIDITPINTANLELLKYRNIFDSSKDAIGLYTLENEEILLNQSFKKIINANLFKSHTFPVNELYVNKEQAVHVFSVLMAGEYWDGDIQLKLADGKIGNYHLSSGPIYNENKELIAVFGIHTDISERKMLEENRVANSKRLAGLLESITDGFYSVTQDWRVTYWNKEAERLLSVSREEILNKNIWDYFPEAKKMLFYSKYQQAFATGEKVSFEEYFEPLQTWFEVSAFPGKDGLSVFFRDITKKRKINEELRFANERFNLVAKATGEAIYDWDIKKGTLEWNDIYFNHYGYTPTGSKENLVQWMQNLHTDDVDGVLAHMNKTLASSSSQWEYEYRLKKSNQKIANILERGSIIRNRQGKAIRMIGVLQDITELKQNERALEELNYSLQKKLHELSISNAELEQFAYIASHDLQEPLRMVTSFLTLLKRKYEDQLDDKARQYIFFANDGAVRMRQIILDLLEYSRIGKLKYEIKPIDLNALLNGILLLNDNLIKEKEARIIYGELPVIMAAEIPLQRVLSNLINNSIKYNENKPLIKFTVAEDEKQWQVNVIDNGIGVDPQFQEKIFVIFQRLHSRDKYTGTGIGLAICKKIVEGLGGKIWITSREGEGSIIHFTIPKQF